MIGNNRFFIDIQLPFLYLNSPKSEFLSKPSLKVYAGAKKRKEVDDADAD